MQRLEIEHVAASYDGIGEATLALNRGRSDSYLDRLRRRSGLTPIARLLLACTRPGDPVVDAGANVGVVAVPLALAGRRVLAVEALGENYVLLVDTSSQSGCEELIPVHAAISDGPGLLDIDGASAFARVRVDDQPGATPAVTLDALAAAHGFTRATALKLDVEGSELAALAGMSDLLASSDLRSLVFEANGAHCRRVGHRPADLITAVRSAGFHVRMLHGETLVPVVEPYAQPLGNVDYVATRDLEPPPGYQEGQLSVGERTGGIVRALTNVNRGYRDFMLNELLHADPEWTGDCSVSATLRALAGGEDVAAAAAARRVLDRSGGTRPADEPDRAAEDSAGPPPAPARQRWWRRSRPTSADS